MNEVSFKDLLPFTFFTVEDYRYVKVPDIPGVTLDLEKINLNAFSFDFLSYVMIKEDITCQPLASKLASYHPYNSEFSCN